ncbi:Rib/alpha-like domain-containing protein [Actinobaculum suis]|uniref:Rib/alpha-like domain-containing protein n=1 Tax=Actinobaculum suis TaxID=1657 RepID=UPI0011475AA6|nr:YPDG domain-containing protein [Actinobaculum suis]
MTGAIEADAIKNGYVDSQTDMTNAPHTLSGRAWEVDTGTPATMANGLSPVPEGTPVYMQFLSKGVASPIYMARTTNKITQVDGSQAGPGAYAFDLRQGFKDAAGTEYKFSSSSLNSEAYRLWIEPYRNEKTGNLMTILRQANGFFPGTFVNTTTGSNIGGFTTDGTNMQRTGVFMYEHPGEWMKAQNVIHDDKGPIDAPGAQLHTSNTVSGQVWLETGGGADRANSATGPNFDPATTQDTPAEGYTVYMSTLTEEGAAANARIKELPQSEQLAETKRLLEENPHYVKTRSAKTDRDGRYTIRWGDYIDESQRPKDFYDVNNMYIWVENPQGDVVQNYSSYTANLFRSPSANTTWTPQAVPAHNTTVTSRVEDIDTPRYGKEVNSSYNVNIALVPFELIRLDITNFNLTDKPAMRGDVAEVELSGTLSPLRTHIEWRDKNGHKVGEDCPISKLNDAKNCTFTIPEDAKDKDVYTAVLVTGGNDVAADSLSVRVYPDDDGDGVDDDERDPDINNDGEVDRPRTQNDQEIVHGVKIVDEYGEPVRHSNVNAQGVILSDGFRTLSNDELQITYGGQRSDLSKFDVTLTDAQGRSAKASAEETATVSAWRGASGFPVVRNFGMAKFGKGTYSVGITDNIDYWAVTRDSQLTNGGFLDVTGNTPTQFVTFGFDADNNGIADVDEPFNERFEPNPVNPVETNHGVEAKSDPITFDNAKTPTKESLDPTAPNSPLAGTTFAIDPTAPDANVPNGATIDANTGVVTIPNNAPSGDFTVPVKVTYPDNTTGELRVEVKVTSKAHDYEPAYEPTDVDPNEVASVAPTFTDKDGAGVTLPDPYSKNPAEIGQVEFTFGTLPAGVEEVANPADVAPGKAYIDPETGEVTFSPSTDQAGKSVELPVVVTYDDTTKDNVNAVFNVGAITSVTQPVYENGSGKPGAEANIPAPTFDNPKTPDVEKDVPPTGTKFELGPNPPAGVNIDENTGAITVPVPTDATPGDTIEVPVVVTYSDGSKDEVTVTVTVLDFGDNEKYQPAYEGKEGKPGDTVTIDKPTFTDKEGNPATPAKVTYGEQPENPVPSGVAIAEDGSIDVPIPDTATNGEKIDVPVRVTYEDGTHDDVTATVTVRTDDDGDGKLDPLDPKNPQPGDDLCPNTPSGATVDSNGCSVAPTVEQPGPITGTVGEPIATVVVKVDNPGKHTELVCKAEGLPAGLDIVYDEAKGGCVITGTPTAEVTDQPVKITVEHKAPETDNPNTDPVVVTTTATINPAGDDDGDGVPNYLDKCLNTPADAKVNENGCSVAPVLGPIDVIEGVKDEAITPIVIPVTNDGKATITACTAENLPAGLEIAYDDAQSACVIKGTPTATGKTADVKITVSYEPVDKHDTHNPAGTIEGSTSANISLRAAIIVPGNPTERAKYDPAYTPVTGKPGETVTVASPTFTDTDGTSANPTGVTYGSPEGTKAPAGVTINPDGSITVVIDNGATNGQIINVPVRVTYSDDTYDDVNATVNVRTDTDGDGYPDPVNPDDPKPGDDKCPGTKPGEKVNEEGCSLNDLNDPNYKPTNASVGVEVSSAAPTFDNPKTADVETNAAPTGTKFALGSDAPANAKIDANTGVITMTPTVEQANQTLNIPVVVTYPNNGGVDETTAQFNVGDTYAAVTTPKWDDSKSRPGVPVVIPNAGDGLPSGSVVAIEECPTGWKCAVQNGDELVVTPPADAPAGAIGKVKVKVTYPDGSEDIETVNVAVVPNPNWDDTTTRPGKGVTIPNKGGEIPEGTTTGVTGPGTSTLNPDGSITVTPNPDAKPGDVIKVTIKDKDGNVIDEITVTIVPNPNWDDATTRPGKDVTIPNTGGDIPAGTTVETEGPGTSTLNPDGSITVTPNPDAKPGDVIKVTIKDKDGEPIDEITVTIAPNPNWDDATTRPGKDVTIPNTGGDVPAGTTVETEGPGTSTLNPDGSITVTPNPDAKPGDVIKVTIKDKDGEPIDEITVTIAPNPNWDDATTHPGKDVTIPNKGGDVPAGTTVEAEGPGEGTLNPDGSITVTPNPDAKPGDVIKVTIKDKDGNVIDEFTVKIVEPEGPAAAKAKSRVKRLSFTGASVLGTLGIAGLLTGVGALLVRRRNR